MRLYRVTYGEWNSTFTMLVPRQTLSVGRDEEEAIANAKAEADSGARNFSAKEVKEVMGHRVTVR